MSVRGSRLLKHVYVHCIRQDGGTPAPDSPCHRIYTPVCAQVAPEAYLVPACCFATAFCLNALTMLFERDGQKFQLAYLGGQFAVTVAGQKEGEEG